MYDLPLYSTSKVPNLSASCPTAFLTKIIFNYVLLPLHLPGKHNNKIDQVESALIKLPQNAGRILRDFTKDGIRNQFDFVCYTLQTCRTVNAKGDSIAQLLVLSLEILDIKACSFCILQNKMPGCSFKGIKSKHSKISFFTDIGHLTSLYISVRGDVVIFEAFEASPHLEKVL